MTPKYEDYKPRQGEVRMVEVIERQQARIAELEAEIEKLQQANRALLQGRT